VLGLGSLNPLCPCERDYLGTLLWNLRQCQFGKTVFRLLYRFAESVSNVRIREQVFWIRRIVFDLDSDLTDECPQIF